jgi:hypothetical protein
VLKDAELLKDPAFKRYATVVDRALVAFETILEWPDYIAFLGRLLKVLPGLSGAYDCVGASSLSHLSIYSLEIGRFQSTSSMS